MRKWLLASPFFGEVDVKGRKFGGGRVFVGVAFIEIVSIFKTGAGELVHHGDTVMACC